MRARTGQPIGAARRKVFVAQLASVCVYCGSSNAADPEYFALARRFGAACAQHGVRLIYGGGDVGLMGATARAAHDAGGKVFGVMPRFLTEIEQPNPDIETVLVDTMHERKQRMFEEADAFAVLPGGIGTLEEVVEMLSWRRLSLHQKPTVFLHIGFWAPLFALFEATVKHRFTPEAFLSSYGAFDDPTAALTYLREAAARQTDVNSRIQQQDL
jgi:uncharacterized protein (TIGR00730 family)